MKEARERARTAIKNSRLVFRLRRITVNLTPAELPKQGLSYDLPLALAILVASGQVEQAGRDAMFLGEIGLNGRLRHTHAIVPMVATARATGMKQVHVPAGDALEAARLADFEIVRAGAGK